MSSATRVTVRHGIHHVAHSDMHCRATLLAVLQVK